MQRGEPRLNALAETCCMSNVFYRLWNRVATCKHRCFHNGAQRLPSRVVYLYGCQAVGDLSYFNRCMVAPVQQMASWYLLGSRVG